MRSITYEDGIRAALFGNGHSSELSALSVSAVVCGIRTIADDIAGLELKVYDLETKSEVPSHPVSLLLDRPNQFQSRPVFIEFMQTMALLHGNAYAEIVRDKSGEATELYPLHPSAVAPQEDGSYKVSTEGSEVYLDREAVLHIPGLSLDGLSGVPFLRHAKHTIDFAIATQSYGRAFFKNASRVCGTLNTERTLGEPAIANIARQWKEAFSGEANTGKTPLLDEGMKFTPLPMSNNEHSQYIEILNFVIEEVARHLKITPMKMFQYGRMTWNNIGHAQKDYLITTVKPWLTKWQFEIERKLLGGDTSLYAEFDTTPIYQIDISTFGPAMAQLVQAGIMSADEVRAYLNLPKKASVASNG